MVMEANLATTSRLTSDADGGWRDSSALCVVHVRPINIVSGRSSPTSPAILLFQWWIAKTR
jgi:hypothetical protein